MTSLVGAMKLALRYSRTLLDADYRRDMLRAAHVIAVDCKHLLDSVDTARRLIVYRRRTSAAAAAAAASSPTGSTDCSAAAADTTTNTAAAAAADQSRPP